VTDETGSFRFFDIPAGSHLLWIWWGPGFINVAGNAINPSVFITPIEVGADGSVRGALPLLIQLNVREPGVVGYPVRGGNGSLPPAVGSVSVKDYLESSIRPPNTGFGENSRTTSRLAMQVVAVIAVLVTGAMAFGVWGRVRRLH
jgi:hypothetical protein